MPLDYLAIGFGGWGQLPVGYIGYILEASPKSSFFRKVPYVIQKKKKRRGGAIWARYHWQVLNISPNRRQFNV